MPAPPDWRPPTIRPGDRVVSAVITTVDGARHPIKLLTRRDPVTGRERVSGYDRPLDMPAGATLTLNIPEGTWP